MKVPSRLVRVIAAAALLSGTAVAAETARALTPAANTAVVKKYSVTKLARQQVKQLDEQCKSSTGAVCASFSLLACGITFDEKVRVSWFTCTMKGLDAAGKRVGDPSQWSTADGLASHDARNQARPEVQLPGCLPLVSHEADALHAVRCEV